VHYVKAANMQGFNSVAFILTCVAALMILTEPDF